MASLVRQASLLAAWNGHLVCLSAWTRDAVDYVLSCEVCQRTQADNSGPLCVLHQLPRPSRRPRGGAIQVDWQQDLPITAQGFHKAQMHIDHPSSKAHTVSTPPPWTQLQMLGQGRLGQVVGRGFLSQWGSPKGPCWPLRGPLLH